MKIALDAMGSDNAPRAELAAVQLALEELPDCSLVIVGRQEILESDRADYRHGERVEFVPAAEVVGMHEPAPEAVKRKQNSSIGVCMDLHRQGKVDAVVSAGNTGAVMAFALTRLGAVPGVHRPTLAVLFPRINGSTLVLDVGANVDTKPNQLLQFAIMGATAAAFFFRKANPSVGLLNIGQEDTKGNELTTAAYRLLKESELNFIGNVEGNEILTGKADVVVCDGFVGNVLLKYGEGLGEILRQLLEQYYESESKYRLRRWFSRPVLEEFISRMDYQEYGGALMLGVQGNVVVAHGRSTPQALKNAIRTAYSAVRDNLSQHIAQAFANQNSG
ncbi:MAG: phosphate acyltransferase PlsX [candidate division WOR-3 bacterium]|uniref:Phosphate acyltransferase n=1 Tax=candidate division WOR-3 bacterium TaxID=2052148 RepID=A0A7C1NAM0_UNCW3|nr:phosphate acyltransferase PlsX [candidate division WOR-3 bacterium]